MLDQEYYEDYRRPFSEVRNIQKSRGPDLPGGESAPRFCASVLFIRTIIDFFFAEENGERGRSGLYLKSVAGPEHCENPALHKTARGES